MSTAYDPALRPLARALAAGDTDPVLLFVEGFAGAGKSCLLQELAGLPEAADAARLWWRCGADGGRPEEEADRKGPLLLLVDDVHRAGEDERRLLRRGLELLKPGSVAAVTYRPEELPVRGLPLGSPALEYPGRSTVLRYRLAPWDEERVRRAAVEAFGEHCTDEAVSRLHRRTGGSPRVVVDLLDALRELRPAFAGTAAEVDAAGTPVRLAELVLSRAHALAPAGRTVVRAAAVLDEPAGRDELLAVAGLGSVAGSDALSLALRGAALAELGEDRYGFASPVAAPAVRDSVPGPLRQELHGRAAKVLSRRQPPAWAAAAAHHRAAGDSRKWLGAVEKAARSATASGRYQQAITLLEQTLATPGLPPQARARLAPLLASSAVTGLRSDQTVDVLTQIVQDAALPVDVRGELRLDLGLMLCNQMGRHTEGWRELEITAAELRDVRPGPAARAMSALAMPYWPSHSIGTHRAWLVQAEAAADSSGDPVMRAAVLANKIGLTMSDADPGAWNLVEQLPTGSTDPACLRQAARGLCNAADSAVWLGFYERAEDLLTEGRTLSARSGAPYTEQTALGTQLLRQWWTGRWTGLAGRCEAFVEATADMPFIASDARVVRGLLAVAQAEWGEATFWLSQRGALGTESLPVPLAATVAGAMIRLALARQDVTAAADQARTAWTAVTDKGVWAWAAELVPWAVEALARAGDAATARAMIRDLAQGLDGREAPAAEAALLWSRAALAETEAAASGQRSGLLHAADTYREAVSAYAELGRPYSRALVAESAARCVLGADSGPGSAGRPDEAAGASAPASGRAATESAIAELELCIRNYGDLGASWDAARTRALLRTRRPAKKGRPPGRPSHADELSPREAEVAQFAASGLTNREIAATLHLSPRTVEQHIAHAMRKTGALSRRDLARRQPEESP